MNEANETTEMWRQIRQGTQARHAANHVKNRSIIDASGIAYADREETLLFRNPDKPKVDFYPSTGRWRIVGANQQAHIFKGGAAAFLSWYQKQTT